MKKASKLSRLVSRYHRNAKTLVGRTIDMDDEQVRRRESKRDRVGGGVARNVSNASAQVCILKVIVSVFVFVFVFISVFVFVFVSIFISVFVYGSF